MCRPSWMSIEHCAANNSNSKDVRFWKKFCPGCTHKKDPYFSGFLTTSTCQAFDQNVRQRWQKVFRVAHRTTI